MAGAGVLSSNQGDNRDVQLSTGVAVNPYQVFGRLRQAMSAALLQGQRAAAPPASRPGDVRQSSAELPLFRGIPQAPSYGSARPAIPAPAVPVAPPLPPARRLSRGPFLSREAAAAPDAARSKDSQAPSFVQSFFDGIAGGVVNDAAGRASAQSASQSQGLCGGFHLPASDPLAPEINAILGAVGRGQANWCPRVTSVSRLPAVERAFRLGLNPPSQIPSGAWSSFVNTLTSVLDGLPPAPGGVFDWRNHNGLHAVSPIEDQGSCGSCWAFASTAQLESQMLIHGAQSMPDESEQVLVSCGGVGNCNGGTLGLAAAYLQMYGLPPASYFPYTATNNSCSNAHSGWKSQTTKIDAYLPVPTTLGIPNVDAIKSALALYGPLSTSFKVYDDFYNYGSGVYSYTSGNFDGWHAVLIVGYDDPRQAFIVKNSWGASWGENGFFKIAYKEVGGKTDFGFQTMAYAGSVSSAHEGILQWIGEAVATPFLFLNWGASDVEQSLAMAAQSVGSDVVKGAVGIGSAVAHFFSGW